MATRTLKVDITGDSRSARRALDQVGASGSKTAGKMQRVGKTVAGAFRMIASSAAIGAVGVGVLVKGGVDALLEIERINAQTQAAIKSTGGAAGVTAKDIETYAGSIEKLTGIEAESIQQGQNMLLTFTNIKNGVGAGNDIFTQSTDVLADMSTAMGSEPKKAAIQLGKALNDPIKGITALSKVGVAFTQGQKDQIKALVESGDTMGAQKIILAELNKEFGGSAEAFGETTAGKVEKLKHAFGEFQEEIAGRVIPVLTTVVAWLQSKLPDAGVKVEEILTQLRPKLDQVGEALQAAGEAVAPVVAAIGRFVKANPAPVFAALAVVIGGALVVAVWAFAAGVIAALSPIYLVAAAVALLAGGFVYAYQKIDWFRTAVDAVASWLSTTVAPALATAGRAIVTAFQAVVAWFQTNWPTIRAVVVTVFNAVRAYVTVVLAAIRGLWGTFGANILAHARTVWGFIGGTIRNALTVIRGVIRIVTSAIRGDWSGVWNGIRTVLGGVWNQIRNIVNTGVNLVKNLMSAAWNAIKAAARLAWDGIKRGVSGAIGGLVSAVRSIPRRVGNVFGFLWTSYRAAINKVIGAWNSLQFRIPAFDPPGPGPKFPGFTLNVPDIPRLHSGGEFRSPPGSSEGLALLRDRERVITPETADRRGGTTVENLTLVSTATPRSWLDELSWRQL